MRTLIRALCVVAALWAGAALAAPLDPVKIAAIDKAADTFLARTKDTYRTAQVPRESDPKVKALLDTVFDTSALAAGGPVPFSDLSKLNDWTMKVVSVGSVYIFAGTGIPDFAHLSTLDEKQQEQIVKNTVAYAPEMGRYFDAEVRLEKALVDSAMAELTAHPASFQNPQAQGGLTKMRDGLKQTLTGVIATFLTPGLDIGWIRARIPALIEIAPSAVKFLSPEARQELRDIAHQVAGQLDDEAAKNGLANFAQAIGL